MAIKNSLSAAALVLFAGLTRAEENFSTRTVDLLIPQITGPPEDNLTGQLVAEEEDVTTYMVGCYPPLVQDGDYVGDCAPMVIEIGPKTYHEYIHWPKVRSDDMDCSLDGTTSAHCTVQHWMHESSTSNSASFVSDLPSSEFFISKTPVTITGQASGLPDQDGTATATTSATGTETDSVMETDTSTAGAAQITGWAAGGAAMAAAAIAAAV